MSDEEKKEYEKLKSLLYTGTISQYGKRKLIDMFEKQQKEIEELKDESKEYQIGFAQGCYEKDLDWKDKIKAKIEEYDDKEMTVNLVNRSAGKTFQQAVRDEVRKVLQSLLEKEGE